ncbi:MAB_1171c family putative transporter [Streptomyces flavalbus]|uniref:MAB_1171c family putative transporter n=1 Tax=Streptomyces flavalbus TaxID=2665155 RepID=A0ABW2W6Q8_9ACTN
MSYVVYLAAAALGLSGVVLFRRPRNPLTLSTSVAVTLAALVFLCSAPLTLAAVNDLTGVPNFGAPLTYGLITAYSCALLILLTHWRGGPRARVRRLVLRSVAAYALLVVAIVVLFALADADTERLRDLDTYYATTPYMREMILLYLLGHSAATLVMAAVCVRWAREVTGLLRIGLRLIVLGALVDVTGFQLTKYTAIAARWTGHDLDTLSTDLAPPMASLAALLCSAGFVLPRLLPSLTAHWQGLTAYRRLAPLWSLLHHVSTSPKPPTSWWDLPQTRLHWREVCIHDALLALAPHFDDRVRAHAHAAALRAGASPHRARIAAEAAMLTDAARRAAAREAPLDHPSTHRLHATEASGASGTSGLVELSQALHHAPTPHEDTARATPNPEEPHVA